MAEPLAAGSGQPARPFRVRQRADVAAWRGAQTGNFYNQYASFLLGLVSNARKSIQHELLTGREWQHGLFIRDRWQASPKLTFDLGLRWEYYPIMQRADRGIERVDLDTLEVLLGGRGGNPTNLGFSAGKDNFAPRVGAIYRLNDSNVFRTGYGVTYNPLPWTRPMRGQYPLTIAANFQQNEPFSWFNRLDQGIPTIALPDLNTGRLPLPAAVSMRTPKPGDIDRGTIQSWNVAYERRLPLDIAVDVAYVGTRGDGGYMFLDINAPTGHRRRQRQPAIQPSAVHRNIELTSMESGLETRYHSLQVGINKPFTKGLLIKGAYTLSKAENMADDDGAGVSWTRRASSTAIWRWRVSTGRTTSTWPPFISSRGRATVAVTATSRARSSTTGRSTERSRHSRGRRSR